MNKSPIFIHSLFRAGSTYLFNVFRRSPAGYCCYYEPLHEMAVFARDEPQRLLTGFGEDGMRLNRHPILDRPYFQELYDKWPHWKNTLCAQAVYNGYFAPPNMDFGIAFWRKLAEISKGRPVFQECRTAGRIGAIKQQLNGYHLYLWRNPWDQWWSYKVTPYFDIANQLFINAPNSPMVVQMLQAELELDVYPQDDISGAFEFYGARPLSSEESYLVFYLLWCLGLQAGADHAHRMLNIDQLSNSPAYQSDIKVQLAEVGINGIDFSDCIVPQGYYFEQDRDFFSALENKVHNWLIDTDWSQDDLDRVQSLRQRFQPTNWIKPIEMLDPQELTEQANRARILAKRFETNVAKKSRENKMRVDAAEAKAQSAEMRAEQTEISAQKATVKAQEAEKRAAQAEAKAQEAATREAQAEAKAQEAATREAQAEAKAQEAATREAQAEAKAQEAEKRAEHVQAVLTNIYNSRLWRITAPWRWAGNVARRFKRGSIAWLTFAPMSRPRRIGRQAIINFKLYFSSRPRRKAFVLIWLALFPGLAARLKMVGKPLSPTPNSLHNNSYATAIEGPENLSPRARQIYCNLKTAIEKRHKELL